MPSDADLGAGWRVVDYNGGLLDGEWATEQDAITFGLCGRYLFSGSHVEPVSPNDGSAS